MRVKRMKMSQMRKNQGGFTLVELMAVVSLSVLSLTFIYYLFVQNSRLYVLQEELASIQSSLRFTTSRLETDIQRAGFMTLLDESDPRRCGLQRLQTTTGSNGRFQAIEFYTANASAGHPVQPPNKPCVATGENPTAADPGCLNLKKDSNLVASDRIELMGNYQSSVEYNADVLYLNNPPNTLQITLGSMVGLDAATFTRYFGAKGQLISIKGQNGKMQIVQVNKADFATRTLTLAAATTGLHLVASSECGIAKKIVIAPLMRLRYRIRAKSNYDWQVVREALYPTCQDTGAQLACNWQAMGDTDVHPPLVIASNVVDLQFWFIHESPLTGMVNLDPRMEFTGGNIAQAAPIDDDFKHSFTGPGNARNLRGVFFRITIRSENEDREFPYMPQYERKNSSDPHIAWELDPKTPGAARVRSLLKQVQLVNFLIQ